MNKLRQTISDSLPEGFEESLSYGMPGWEYHTAFTLTDTTANLKSHCLLWA